MKAINSTNNEELASRLAIADNLFARMKGLLGRSALAEGEGLLIMPCKGIHTFGMKFPIDAIFLDSRNVVIAIWKVLSSNCLSLLFPKAASVLELPAGTIEATATTIGDEIKVA